MGISVSVRTGKIRDLDALLEQWQERTQHVRDQFTYLATEYVYEHVRDRIPNSQEFKNYRESLAFSRVLGAGPDAVFAVHIDSKSRHVHRVEARKTLIYVKSKRSTRRTPAEIAVLERYNPWTVSTLPFSPKKRWAVLVQQKSTGKAVDRVEAARRHDRPLWQRELAEAGVRTIQKDHGIKLPKKLEVLPDVALEGIRLEFGLEKRAEPHWRPAILRLLKSDIRKLLRQKEGKELIKALTESGFTKWKKWPKRTRRKLRLNEVKKFKGFQKRLGIRPRK